MEILEKPVLESDEVKLLEAARLHAESPKGKELSGEELALKAVQTVSGQTTSAVGAPLDSVATNPLTGYAENESQDIKEKIEDLLQIAAKDGIVKAAGEAAKTSPFVLDAFHDALAAKLYPYLKEKGLLK